jgi:hypothetical protein
VGALLGIVKSAVAFGALKTAPKAVVVVVVVD